MNRSSVMAMLGMVNAAHARELDGTAFEDQVDVWTLLLGDVGDEEGLRACKDMLRTSPFPPKPSEIIALCRPALKAPEEAWAEFRDHMREPRRMELPDGRTGVPLPTWTNAMVRAAGADVAAETVQLVEYGMGSEYELRKRYCAAYERLVSDFRATGELPDHVAELRPSERHQPGTVVLGGVGRISLAEPPQPPALPPGADTPEAEEARHKAIETMAAMQARSLEMEE